MLSILMLLYFERITGTVILKCTPDFAFLKELLINVVTGIFDCFSPPSHYYNGIYFCTVKITVLVPLPLAYGVLRVSVASTRCL